MIKKNEDRLPIKRIDTQRLTVRAKSKIG